MDNSRWSDLPNNVLNDGQPVAGMRLPDGTIQCQKCTRTFEDNRNDQDRACGRKPSCPFCWVALDVANDDGNPFYARSAAWTPGLFGYAERQGDRYIFRTGQATGLMRFEDEPVGEPRGFVTERGTPITEDLVLPHGRPCIRNQSDTRA